MESEPYWHGYVTFENTQHYVRVLRNGKIESLQTIGHFGDWQETCDPYINRAVLSELAADFAKQRSRADALFETLSELNELVGDYLDKAHYYEQRDDRKLGEAYNETDELLDKYRANNN